MPDEILEDFGMTEEEALDKAADIIFFASEKETLGPGVAANLLMLAAALLLGTHAKSDESFETALNETLEQFPSVARRIREQHKRQFN